MSESLMGQEVPEPKIVPKEQDLNNVIDLSERQDQWQKFADLAESHKGPEELNFGRLKDNGTVVTKQLATVIPLSSRRK
jgi:hypothetical protein